MLVIMRCVRCMYIANLCKLHVCRLIVSLVEFIFHCYCMNCATVRVVKSNV